ncbi:hypothetical protein GIB67_022273 [Kingdonia uniflora]|uniref:Alpha-1,3-mannosyl-glycoprotein 2-beta-N-acetylglucosaminyltransferase n=1 Tax=Kingdonia uniflora TaxID=39325 RepID=A0A7J7M6Z6_9MAGN|nr:hypothetical protein GIB67_022273 [Kingdonia uniflora]
MADLQRSIPSMVDGLKPGLRKILFSSFKHNFTKEAKVAQFSGYVSGHSAYHHGEQNLAGTIIGMTQDFVGSNNINLLQPNGQFGNQHQGGKDHASSRYVYTCLSPITRFLFPKDDDCLLDYLNEDGQSIERTWYMPTIPMVLFNSSEAAFIYIQMRLFGIQSSYTDRLAAAEQIVSLEEKKKSQDQECGQLRALVHDLERKGAQNVVDKLQVPVAAAMIMACNRPNYLERKIESILKYQGSVASKFILFIFQDGPNENVKHKALSYNQITYMQHLDFGTVQTERPGELIAYYKIASHYKWALDGLFYKHNFTRVINLEDDMKISPKNFGYFEAAATLMDKKIEPLCPFPHGMIMDIRNLCMIRRVFTAQISFLDLDGC